MYLLINLLYTFLKISVKFFEQVQDLKHLLKVFNKLIGTSTPPLVDNLRLGKAMRIETIVKHWDEVIGHVEGHEVQALLPLDAMNNLRTPEHSDRWTKPPRE